MVDMTYTQEDEVAMMLTPGKWPHWPFLPLKKVEERSQRKYGTLFELGITEPPVLIWYEGVVLFDTALLKEALNDPCKGVHVNKTALEKLVEDGWMVD